MSFWINKDVIFFIFEKLNSDFWFIDPIETLKKSRIYT